MRSGSLLLYSQDSQMNTIHKTTSMFKIRFNTILPPTPKIFLSISPIKTLYEFSSPLRAMFPAHLFPPDLINLIIMLREKYQPVLNLATFIYCTSIDVFFCEHYSQLNSVPVSLAQSKLHLLYLEMIHRPVPIRGRHAVAQTHLSM